MSVLDSFSLAGKVALVTGGAGLYGRQIVAALSDAGADTYIASRNLEALEALAAEQRGLGRKVTALALDQSDEGSVFVLRDRILESSGRIDVLVNNAVARPMSGYADNASAFTASMQVNATGLFMITRAVGDAMAQTCSGSIINIGSIYGIVGPDPTNYEGTEMHGWYPDYFFHKGGMINFTRFVASYYGPKGIRCNCISPGGLGTESQKEEFVRQYCARTFLDRMANPRDLAGIIILLASDASAYITGTNIPVDGGYTAK